MGMIRSINSKCWNKSEVCIKNIASKNYDQEIKAFFPKSIKEPKYGTLKIMRL